MTADATGLFIGLMSGTSADGIDAALCRFTPRPELVAAIEHPWPDVLRRDMLALAHAATEVSLDHVGHLDSAIGEGFADAVEALVEHAGIEAGSVRAVASHGQTVRHRAHGEHPFTQQLGNPWIIAERCGIDTVSDFRRADMAAGGQGAPLMPAFHAHALGASGTTRGVLNLGGIANLTVLGADGSVHGFDTGPGNGLMDAWCQRHCSTPMDRDGIFAARGSCNEQLLADLLADPYFARTPPKSTGREYFGPDWLDRHVGSRNLPAADVQATLLALTVTSIADAVIARAPDCEQLLVCGGGVHNIALMERLAQALSCRVDSTAALGVNPDYVEAMGFAWLARQRLLGESANMPAVTGARGPRLLGSVQPAPRT